MSEGEVLSPTKAYYLSGMGHCNAALIIHAELMKQRIERTDSTWIALGNVLGMAVEVTLKAYLSGNGVERNVLTSKKYGHNLPKLYEESEKYGLRQDGVDIGQPDLSEVFAKFIAFCSENYIAFDYRYLEAPSFAVLESDQATATIISALRYLLDIVKARWLSVPEPLSLP